MAAKACQARVSRSPRPPQQVNTGPACAHASSKSDQDKARHTSAAANQSLSLGTDLWRAAAVAGRNPCDEESQRCEPARRQRRGREVKEVGACAHHALELKRGQEEVHTWLYTRALQLASSAGGAQGALGYTPGACVGSLSDD